MGREEDVGATPDRRLLNRLAHQFGAQAAAATVFVDPDLAQLTYPSPSVACDGANDLIADLSNETDLGCIATTGARCVERIEPLLERIDLVGAEVVSCAEGWSGLHRAAHRWTEGCVDAQFHRQHAMIVCP